MYHVSLENVERFISFEVREKDVLNKDKNRFGDIRHKKAHLSLFHIKTLSGTIAADNF